MVVPLKIAGKLEQIPAVTEKKRGTLWTGHQSVTGLFKPIMKRSMEVGTLPFVSMSHSMNVTKKVQIVVIVQNEQIP